VAAGATKTYTALFQIGGKMLGSFRGVMQLAEARLRRLRATAASIGNAFKGLLAPIASFVAGIVGYGAGKILGNLFGGAVEQAREAETRFKSIQVTMLKNAQLMRMAGGDRAKALELGKEQAQLLKDQADALAKEGVLRDDIYQSMAKQMSIAGVPTKSIMHSVRAMGDLLVAIDGVNASEQRAAELADAVDKAIFKGRTKPLEAFVGPMPKDWWKQQIALGHGYQDMLDDILKRMEFAKGANVREAFTPLGRLQRAQNQLEDLSEDIGKEMIPLQAEMAEMWAKALPELKPAIIFMFKGLLWIMRKVAQVVTQYVMPAFAKLQAWWNTQTPQAQKRWIMIGLAIAGVAAALVLLGAVALPIIAAIVAALTSPVTGAIAAIVASVIGMMVFWRFAGAYITAAASATWEFLKAGWQMLTDFFVTLWNAVSPELAAIWEDIKVVASVFWDWFKVAWQTAVDVVLGIWHTIEPVVLPLFDKIKAAWQFIVEAFEKAKPTIINVLKEVGKVFIDWLLEPLKKFRWIFDKVAGAINRFRPAGAAAGGGAGAAVGGGAAGGGVKAVSQAAAPFIAAPLGMGGPAAGLAAGAMPMTKGAGAAAAALGGGVPVTVASYGGPTEPGQVVGAYNNRLQAGDVAISPNLYGTLGAPGPGSYLMLDGQRYHIADSSWYTPGNPTSNMVEIWGYGNQIKKQGMATRAYAEGGIAMKPQIATLAERGPEAVFPMGDLSKVFAEPPPITRTMGDLSKVFAEPPITRTMRDVADAVTAAYNAASDQTAMGGGETHVNFSPNITIHGNATEAEQRAMDSRLRDLKDDFIKQFEAAQRQSRRLSYEGGYG